MNFLFNIKFLPNIKTLFKFFLSLFNTYFKYFSSETNSKIKHRVMKSFFTKNKKVKTNKVTSAIKSQYKMKTN